MKRLLTVFVCLIAFSACSSSGPSGDLYSLSDVQKGDVVLTINDLEVHQGLLDVLSELNPRIKTQLDNPLTRKKLLDSLVDQQLLYQEAVKRGLDKSSDVVLKSYLNQNVIVSNALVEDELTKSLKKTYDERKASQFTRLKVSMIAANFSSDAGKPGQTTEPTNDQKKAALDKIQKLKTRISKGEDFGAVAESDSDDKMTAKKKGDAGQVSKDDKRFERLGLTDVVKKAYDLKKGQVSDPIETKTGYYLVKVESDPIEVPFDEAERTLRFEMQANVKQQLINDLKTKAKIAYVGGKEADAKSTQPQPTDVHQPVQKTPDATATDTNKPKTN